MSYDPLFENGALQMIIGEVENATRVFPLSFIVCELISLVSGRE